MRRRFFLRNFAVITLPVILVVLLLGFMAIYITMKSAKNAITMMNEQTVSRIQEGTELIFNEADAQSLNYNVSAYVLLRLEALLNNGYSDKPEMDVAYMIKTFLDSDVNSKPYLHSIYLYLNNSAGNFFSSSVGLANNQNYRDISWMQQHETMPAEFRQWLELRNVGAYAMSAYSADVLTLYKRWYRTGQIDPFGVIVVNIRRDYLQRFYQSHLLYPEQGILLLNADGSVLASAGTLHEGISSLTLQQLEANYFISQRKDSSFGVSYLSMMPKHILVRQATDMLYPVIVAVVFSLLIGGVIAYIFTRKSVSNVGDILLLIQSAEQGDEIPPIRNSGDMYGYIMQNIVRIFLEKNSLDRQLIEKKYKLEKMQFSFLQSQLNPHFLFNTLKNIFWKTVSLTGEPNEASRMIDLLTSLLHYALVNREPDVPIEEELEHTRRYIQIQQMRFEGGFRVEWDCMEDFEQARCIKFLLQPLVENSISHGLKEKENGRIRIAVKNDGEHLNFCVSDNGHGLTSEKLGVILQWLTLEDSPVESIGLYNLNKRLVLVYGLNAGLKIDSVPEEGTSIRFSIPLIERFMKEDKK